MTAVWASKPLLSVDTETTGVDCWNDRIAQIGHVLVHPDGTVEDPVEDLVRIDVDMPAEATEIHGLTRTRCRAEGTTAAIALDRVLARIADHDGAVVIYNARFDWPLLFAEHSRWAGQTLVRPFPPAWIIDPLVIERHLVKIYKAGAYKLTTVADRYGVVLGDDAHSALADATASARVVWAQVAANPSMAACELPQLCAWQMRWQEDQRLDFEDYMRRKRDPEFSDPPGWPMPVRFGVAA